MKYNLCLKVFYNTACSFCRCCPWFRVMGKQDRQWLLDTHNNCCWWEDDTDVPTFSNVHTPQDNSLYLGKWSKISCKISTSLHSAQFLWNQTLGKPNFTNWASTKAEKNRQPHKREEQVGGKSGERETQRKQHGSLMEQPELRESAPVKADENLIQFTPLIREWLVPPYAL